MSKYLTGNISALEEETLFKWLNVSDENLLYFKKYKTIYDIDINPNLSFKPNRDKAWKNVLENIETKTYENKSFINNSLFLKIAASIVVIFSVTLLILNNPKKLTYQTTSQVKSFVLPDSSVVLLNKNSCLTYCRKFGTREVDFKGEGYFKVQHINNSTFTIKTQKSKVTVIGTEFNLISNNHDEEVAVINGLVNYQIPEIKENVNLEGGFSAQKNDADFIVSEITDNNFLYWKTGVLNFNNEKIDNIFSFLEKHHNINIVIPQDEIKKLRFTGSFTNLSLIHMFEIICLATGTKYEKQGDDTFTITH